MWLPWDIDTIKGTIWKCVLLSVVCSHKFNSHSFPLSIDAFWSNKQAKEQTFVWFRRMCPSYPRIFETHTFTLSPPCLTPNCFLPQHSVLCSGYLPPQSRPRVLLSVSKMTQLFSLHFQWRLGHAGVGITIWILRKHDHNIHDVKN